MDLSKVDTDVLEDELARREIELKKPIRLEKLKSVLGAVIDEFFSDIYRYEVPDETTLNQHVSDFEAATREMLAVFISDQTQG